MSDKVVILIFAYKPMPEWYVAISLEQCFRVLTDTDRRRQSDVVLRRIRCGAARDAWTLG
jgi:hypothetical protein